MITYPKESAAMDGAFTYSFNAIEIYNKTFTHKHLSKCKQLPPLF